MQTIIVTHYGGYNSHSKSHHDTERLLSISNGITIKKSMYSGLCGKQILFLLQFTQLYKWVPGHRQVVDMCTSSFHALIVAYGWMLPREVETVFD